MKRLPFVEVPTLLLGRIVHAARVAAAMDNLDTARARAIVMLNRARLELNAPTPPVPGQRVGAVDVADLLACPNLPPCRHPALVHDTDELSTPRPMCYAPGCTCGRPAS